MIFKATGNEFLLEHRGKVILRHSKNSPLIYVGEGQDKLSVHCGHYSVDRYIVKRLPLYVTEIVQQKDTYRINFDDIIAANLTIKGDVVDIDFACNDDNYNRFWIRSSCSSDEKFFGMGEQFSYLNLKGRNYPVFTSEPGIGRDKTSYITWRVDSKLNAGGDYYTTNYPQPTYVSSNLYYLHLNSTAFSDFNFKNDAFSEIEVWEIPKSIRVEGATDYIDIFERLTAYLGRQPQLPDWIYNGLILGLQGGIDRTLKLLQKSLDNGIKVSGVWCQDWCGKRETSFGKRLQWNWQYHEKMYPDLPKKIEELHAAGIKFLGYINPYLVQDGELYRVAAEKNYFVKRDDGSDYLINFGEFICGTIDFTNPDAYNWFRDEVIIKHSIDIGIDGWMADFAEYLPVDDVKLFNGSAALIEHNKWPVYWAKCNYDAVEKAGKLTDVVYFMRAGGAKSGRYCTLLWAGDQSVDFSLHDGLASTIPAALSAGMSGMGLSHSDIGGYTSILDNLRDKELFERWAEMAAFTPVMRTHEGNRPDTNFQYYDDEATMKHLAKFVDVYTMLSPYLKDLVLENSTKGVPVQRPLFVHYPDDERAYDLQYQYLFGSDILVAPVHESAVESWPVYLPQDSWVHLFTAKEYGQGSHDIAVPIGCPAVFYKKSSPYASLFKAVTEKYS